jgi:hypothetical protein
MSLPNQSVQPSKLIFPIHINCEHDPKIAKAFRRRTGFNKMPTANRVKGGSRRVDAEVPRFRGLDFNGMQAEKCAGPLMHAGCSFSRSSESDEVISKAATGDTQSTIVGKSKPRSIIPGETTVQSIKKEVVDQGGEGKRGSPCRTGEQTAKGSEGPNVVMTELRQSG